jgi:eukaryotic-like serine/threonine-protein kinase
VSFAKGVVVGGRYPLLRLLGEGGLGEVWEAESQLFGRVAVKVLKPDFANDPGAVSRFASEARAAANISHPNVVSILDLGETKDKVPFFVMELCEGETLDLTIASRGGTGVSYSCELISQVLLGLDAAHTLGIVHRDLKPGNIIVMHPQPDHPLVKVLDFGIACHVRQIDEYEKGRIFGTPAYMAPEQIVGGTVDARTDLYACGALLYELLTGRPPFSGRSDAEVMTAVLHRPPKPMRAFVRSLPAELELLVRRCLAKDPTQRPPDAAELRRDVLAFAPPPSRARVPTPRPRERKKSLPVPLVKQRTTTVPSAPQLPSEPLPLVRRSLPGPSSTKRPVLELVHDAATDEKDKPSSPG